MKKTHVVSVLSQKLALRTEADEDYVKGVAAFVEGRLRDVMKQAPSASTLTAALMTCLNIADTLFGEKKAKSEAAIKAGHRIKNLIEKIEKRLTDH